MTIMKSRMLRLVATLALALAPSINGALLAAEPAAPAGNYRVEIIILRGPAPVGSEDLAAPAEGRGFDERRDTGGAPPKLVRMLEASELQMTAQATQLRNSGGWQVLAHSGWIQGATPWRRHVGLPLEQLGIAVPGLRGTLYLERGDYLHFGAFLQLGENPAYELSELRRVKINEKHYLDHPAFGVIVQVSQAR
jgi:hypothetical protein